MRRLFRSIRGRLFLLFFVTSSMLLTGIGIFLYHEARSIVMSSVDAGLHSKMQVMTGLLHEEHGGVELELSETILGEYSIPRSGHYYKVIKDNKTMASSPSLVNSSFDLAAGRQAPPAGRTKDEIYTSVGPDDEPVRVLQYDLRAFGSDFSFFVAESLVSGISTINRFRDFLLLVIPSAVLVLCIAGIWITRRSLLPLDAFSDRIGRITHMTLDEKIDSGKEMTELAGLAGSFNVMLERLRQVFESERRFIADASHELKTPVAVIRAECDVALQRERGGEEYIAAIESVRGASENMENKIKALLSLARLDSGILSPLNDSLVSVNECVQEAIGMMRPIAERNGIRVSFSSGEPVLVQGNRDSLMEAFINILENGLNYNRENGSLAVSVSEVNGKVHISFRDTGCGIRTADLPRIFDRFFRSEPSRGREGTGLGLSIAKSVIESHGGEIMVKSEPGQGSIFTAILPVSRQ